MNLLSLSHSGLKDGMPLAFRTLPISDAFNLTAVSLQLGGKRLLWDAAWNITEGPLEEKMKNLRDAGYRGSYSAEFHAGKHEYAHVTIQLAKMRAVFDRWRTAGSRS